MPRDSRRHAVGKDLLKGAIAGAAATFVMDQITTYMYQREDRRARRREDEVRGEASGTLHWGLGIGAGAVYAVLRRRFDLVGSTAGTAFGTAFWTIMDEGLVPALGLTAGPLAFPWQTHALGLVGHLTFGTVTHRTLRVLDRVM